MPVPYVESYSVHRDPDDPHAYAATNALLSDLPDAAGQEQTKTGYAPDLYTQLAALKAKYDPANLFRFNRNVMPKGR